MNSRLTGMLFAAALIVAGPARAATDPAPQAYLKYGGEEIPVYAPGQIQPTRTAKPDYPRSEQEDRVAGHAALIVVVGLDGRPIASDVAESKPTASFGRAAQACIKDWRFPPLKLNGTPTKYALVVPFEFTVR